MFNKLKTKNYQLTAKRRAFTLMEILISASIFAIIMIIATGVFGQSSSYRGKIKAMRAVNEDSKRIADQITRDVKTANRELSVNIPSSYTLKNGLAISYCSDTGCTLKNYGSLSGPLGDGDPFGTPSLNANTLVIAAKDSIKVYIGSVYIGSADNKLYYKSFPNTEITATILISDILGVRANSNIINNGVLTETAVNFGGYCKWDGPDVPSQQPYVSFFITSRTKGYNELPVASRALTQIKSTVASRNFAN